jgi:hypothetical protein
VCWWLRGGRLPSWWARLWDEAGDLDEVVVEDAVSAPGSGAVDGVASGAGPAEVAFEAVDASFRSGSPSDQSLEGAALLEATSSDGGFAFARQYDGAHAEGFEGVFDGLFSVAAIGGDRSGNAASPRGDARDAGTSMGASGGLPISTLWSSTIPS